MSTRLRVQGRRGRVGGVGVFIKIFLYVGLFAVSKYSGIIRSTIMRRGSGATTGGRRGGRGRAIRGAIARRIRTPGACRAAVRSSLESTRQASRRGPVGFALATSTPVRIPSISTVYLGGMGGIAVSRRRPRGMLSAFTGKRLLGRGCSKLTRACRISKLACRCASAFPSLRTFDF